MNGSALRVYTGFIPFGNSEHFLYPEQMSKIESSRIETNFKTIVSQVKCPISLVNSCLEPKATFLMTWLPYLMKVLLYDGLIKCSLVIHWG